MEEELRQSNKELLQTLRIGQKKAWDILNQDKGMKINQIKPKAAYTCSTPSKAQYTCSTPSKAQYTYSTPSKAQYLSLLADQGNSKVMDTTDLNSSNHGRPHKTPTRKNRPLLNYSYSSEPHSPLCSENHRAKLNTQLNKSYTQLADDLRRLAPYCNSDISKVTTADTSTLSVKPESYYDDIRRFRLAHSAECSVKLADEKTLIEEHEKTISESTVHSVRTGDTTVQSMVEQPHQCIQTYTVGPGYRADDDHSCEQCPLCVGADDTKLRGLIRVNIPESDTVKYGRKLNFNPDSLDSLGLSKHCATGWKQSRTQYKVPTIPSFGYKAVCTE